MQSLLHEIFSLLLYFWKKTLILIHIPSVHLLPLTSKREPVNSFKNVLLPIDCVPKQHITITGISK